MNCHLGQNKACVSEGENIGQATFNICSAGVVQELWSLTLPRTSLQVLGQLYNWKESGENSEDVAQWVEFSKSTCKAMGSIPN